MCWCGDGVGGRVRKKKIKKKRMKKGLSRSGVEVAHITVVAPDV